MKRSRWAAAALMALVLALSGLQAPAADAAARVTMAALKSAKVPAACGYKGGKLRNGLLPGISPGVVRLVPKLTVIGPVVPGQKSGAAATFQCSHGGASWPNIVVIYDSALRPLRVYDTGSVGYYSGRAEVQSIQLKNRVVTVHSVGIGQRGDSDRWGTASATVTLKYDSRHRQIVQSKPTLYTERPAFVSLVKAVNARDRKKALKYATASTVDDMFTMVKYWPYPIKAMECIGVNDVWERAQSLSVSMDAGQRACRAVFTFKSASGRVKTTDPYIIMGPANAGRTTFKGLRVTWL